MPWVEYSEEEFRRLQEQGKTGAEVSAYAVPAGPDVAPATAPAAAPEPAAGTGGVGQALQGASSWIPEDVARQANPEAAAQSIGRSERMRQVLEANRGKEFVGRMYDPNAPKLDAGGGNVKTHKMATEVTPDGRWLTFPTIVRGQDGALRELPLREAMDHAIQTGEYVELPKQQALEFGEHYKEGLPGGTIPQADTFVGPKQPPPVGSDQWTIEQARRAAGAVTGYDPKPLQERIKQLPSRVGEAIGTGVAALPTPGEIVARAGEAIGTGVAQLPTAAELQQRQDEIGEAARSGMMGAPAEVAGAARAVETAARKFPTPEQIQDRAKSAELGLRGGVGEALRGAAEAVDAAPGAIADMARQQASGTVRAARLALGEGGGGYSAATWRRAAGAARMVGLEDAAKWLDERAAGAERFGAKIAGAPADNLPEKVFSAAGRVPFDLMELGVPAKFLGPTVGFAVHGATTTALEGGSPLDVAESAALGAGTGKIVHEANTLLQPKVRVPALAGLFAAPGALEGRDAEDVATDAIVGGALGVLGGPGMPLGKRPPQRPIRAGMEPDPDLPPELATPAPEVPPPLAPAPAPVPPPRAPVPVPPAQAPPVPTVQPAPMPPAVAPPPIIPDLPPRAPAPVGQPVTPVPQARLTPWGPEAEVNLSTGEKLPTRYAWAELDDLVTSHEASGFRPNPKYAMGEQQRDYAGSPAEQSKVILGAQQFDPSRIYDSGATPLEGPPIITPSGQVLGGNGRTMIAWRAEVAQPGRLKAAAQALGAKLGLDPEYAAGMNKPVPVRIYDQEPTGRAAQELSARLNEAPGIEVGPTEFAVNAAKRLTERSMNSILDSVNRLGDDSPSIADALRGNRDLVVALEKDGILTGQNRAKYVVLDGPERGTLNADGRAMISRALLSRVLPDKELQENMPAAFRNRITRSVPSILALDAEFPELRFGEQIADVARSETRRKEAGQSPHEFFAQQELAGQAPSQADPELRRLHEFFLENGDRKVADAISGYREAMVQGREQGNDLFGTAFEPRDLPKVFFPTRAPEDVSGLIALARRTRAAEMTPEELTKAGFKIEDRSAALEHKLYEVVTWRGPNGEAIVEYRPVEGWKAKSGYELPRVVARNAEEQEAFHRALGAPQRGTRLPGDAPRAAGESAGVRAMRERAAAMPSTTSKRRQPGGPGPLHVGFRDVDASAPGAKTPKELKKRGELVGALSRAFGIPIWSGRKFYVKFGKDVTGYFRHGGPSTGELRLMTWGDFQTFSHEIAHYLADFRNRKGEFPFPMFRALSETKDPTLEAELRSISYDENSTSEGYAEAMRLYLTQPSELAKRAPTALRAIEAAVDQLPRKQRRALQDFREDSQKLFAQGGRGELRAMTGADGLPLESALEDAVDRARQKHVDDLHGLLRAERILEDGPQRDGIYEVARRVRAARIVAEGIYKYGAPVWKDVENNGIGYSGKGLRDILAPVAKSKAMLNDFFDYAIARQAREIESHKITSGLSKQAIADGEKIAGEKGNEKFEDAFDELVEFQARVADFAEEAGLFSAESRRKWRRKEYAFGFFRQMQDARQGAGYDLATGSDAPRAVRMMRGSGRSLRDPMENLLQGPRNLIMASMENRVRAKVAKFLRKPGGGMFGRYVGPQDKKVVLSTSRAIDYLKKELERKGMSKQDLKALDILPAEVPLIELWMPEKPKLDNLMTVLEGGEPRYYEINDKGLLDSVAAMRRPSSSGAVGLMNAMRRFTQKTITLAPDFIARNMARDSIMASVMSRTGFQHLSDSWKGVVDALRESPEYRDFMANGGGGGTLFETPEAHRRDVIKFAKRKGLDPRSLIVGPRDVVNFLERLGHATEMGPRLAEYRRAVKKGESPTHAAYLGREVSTDFSVRGSGEIVNFLSNTVPFFNAMMASTDRFYRGVATDPDYKAKTAMRVGMYALASMALHAYNRGIDEYNDLPDWAKSSYMHFPIPKGVDPETGKQKYDFARMPRVWEVGAIGRASELFVDALLGRKDTGSEDEGVGMEAIRVLLDNFNLTPPPALLPLIEQATNRTWFTGSPIVPMGEANEEAWSQTTGQTPRVLEKYGEAVRNAPLPDFAKSPARAEALLRGVFNHFATYGLMAADRLFFPGAAEKHADELPVAKSFYAEGGKYNRVVDKFYETLETATKAAASYKDMVKENKPELADELAQNPDVALSKMLNRANKKVQDMNKERLALQRDDSLSPAEKRAKIDELVKERNEFMRHTLELYEEEKTARMGEM